MGLLTKLQDKQTQVVAFSSTAIALYGYDQGMMSLINTNYNYLDTLNIPGDSAQVGIIVAIYYLGCAVGAVIASWAADKFGRKPSMFICLATSSIGNLIMFLAGFGVDITSKEDGGAFWVMLAGRIVMGLGVGGIDSVVPIFSSVLSEDDARGKALAQEIQMNILGLNIAFAANLIFTNYLGKDSQWAWRLPIIIMQAFPLLLMVFIIVLPESPRFFVSHGKEDEAKAALETVYPQGDTAQKRFEELAEAHKNESDKSITYMDMLTPGHLQFHPTIITIMGQVNQALTGYGAISVYGPQIFALLGFDVMTSEYITQANYVSYLIFMTLAWVMIDAVGRRSLMVWNSAGLIFCFFLLTIFAGLSYHSFELNIPNKAVAIPGTVLLYIATVHFGVGWLATVWLIPTEIYPTSARAKGTAISVILWGIMNFIVTFITPLLFSNLKYWLFLILCVSNAFAGIWTYVYLPETGGRSFEENQQFFKDAQEEGSWRVSKVKKGEYRKLPGVEKDNGETEPLLGRLREQL